VYLVVRYSAQRQFTKRRYMANVLDLLKTLSIRFGRAGNTEACQADAWRGFADHASQPKPCWSWLSLRRRFGVLLDKIINGVGVAAAGTQPAKLYAADSYGGRNSRHRPSVCRGHLFFTPAPLCRTVRATSHFWKATNQTYPVELAQR